MWGWEIGDPFLGIRRGISYNILDGTFVHGLLSFYPVEYCILTHIQQTTVDFWASQKFMTLMRCKLDTLLHLNK